MYVQTLTYKANTANQRLTQQHYAAIYQCCWIKMLPLTPSSGIVHGEQYLFSESSPVLLRVFKLKGLPKQGVEGLQEAVVGA